MLLTCPTCKTEKADYELMVAHLVTRHGITKRGAAAFVRRMEAWKRGDVDPQLFLQLVYQVKYDKSDK